MSEQTFDFFEAIKRMKQGKKVKRRGWFSDTGIFIFGNNLYEKNYKRSYYLFSLDDIFATDWEEVIECGTTEVNTTLKEYKSKKARSNNDSINTDSLPVRE